MNVQASIKLNIIWLSSANSDQLVAQAQAPEHASRAFSFPLPVWGMSSPIAAFHLE
jgi:hypothetical protein